MTTEHDEALVLRVALALNNRAIARSAPNYAVLPQEYRDEARTVIYPPAPPKTRLQVARELLSLGYAQASEEHLSVEALTGKYDDDGDMRAVLAALALPAMEDDQ